MIYVVCKGVRNYNGVHTSTVKIMIFGSINGKNWTFILPTLRFFDNFDT